MGTAAPRQGLRQHRGGEAIESVIFYLPFRSEPPLQRCPEGTCNPCRAVSPQLTKAPRGRSLPKGRLRQDQVPSHPLSYEGAG